MAERQICISISPILFLFFFVLILNLQPIFILPLPPTTLRVQIALFDIMATHTVFTTALSY